MSYTVEITIIPIQVKGEEQPARMYQLPEPFNTVAEARDATNTHIAELGVDPAYVLYNVFDREGFTVASNAEEPVAAV